MHPVDRYAIAREKYKSGQKDEALRELALAIGVEKPSAVMLNNLDKMFEQDCELHEGIISLVLVNRG